MKGPWRNLLRGVTKSGDYTAEIDSPHVGFYKSMQLEHQDIEAWLPLA
jgi:hypothetical protein